MSTYHVDVAASVAAYAREIAKLPGLTEKQAARAAVSMQKQLVKGMEKAAKDAEKSSGKLLGHFTFTPSDIAGALRALDGLAESAIAVQTEMRSLSDRTGLSVKVIGGIKLAAESAGLSLDQVGDGLENLPDAIRSAAEGTGDAAEMFETLGIKATDANGNLRSTDEVFRDFVTEVGKLPTPIEKAAAATALLGDSGARILAAGLGEGAEVLDTFTAAAERSGLTSREAAEGAKEWTRASALLGTAVEGTGQKLMATFGHPMSLVLKNFGKGFAAASAFIMERARTMLSGLGTIGKAMSALFSGDFRKAADLAMEGIDDLLFSFDPAIDAAREAVVAYNKSAEAIERTGDSAETTAAAMRRLKIENQKAAAAAAKAAAEQVRDDAKAAKEREALIAQVEALAQANAEAIDPIEARYNAELYKLDDLTSALQAHGLLNARTLAEIQEGYRQIEATRTAAYEEETQKLADLQQQRAAQEQAAHDAILQQIEDEKQARLDAVSTGVAFATQATDLIVELAAREAQAMGATEEEIARIRQKGALLGAIVNTAEAVTRALASSPPPFNFVAAATVGAAGALQIATIKSASSGGNAGAQVASYGDTPGVQRMGPGGQVRLAAGDYFAAAQSPRELQQQVGGPGTGEIRVSFQLGTRTYQEQVARASRQPGPQRRLLGATRPWRRSKS